MIAFALQAAAAFNLICIGTEVAGPLSADLVNSSKREPYSITYRVDLGQRRWCSGDCVSTETLAALSDSEIVFSAEPGPRLGGSARINRETGRFMDLTTFGDDAVLREGTCERAPFTGFPQRRF